MLELQCTCGWRTTGESMQALLAPTMAHMPDCIDQSGMDPIDEPVLRALIAQRARPIDA